MKINQYLRVSLIISFLLFADFGVYGYRLEGSMDTVVAKQKIHATVPGRTKSKLSVGLGLATIGSSYLLAALYLTTASASIAILAIPPVLGIVTLILGFGGLKENRRFLRSRMAVTIEARKRQRRVRKSGIAGITIGIFGLLLAMLLLIGNKL